MVVALGAVGLRPGLDFKDPRDILKPPGLGAAIVVVEEGEVRVLRIWAICEIQFEE